VADGHTNAEIASTLSVSTNTVHTHVAHILNKLEVDSRRTAGRIYRALSALPPELELTLESELRQPVQLPRTDVERLLSRLGVRDLQEARRLYRSIITRTG
jgi:hypothetical protein